MKTIPLYKRALLFVSLVWLTACREEIVHDLSENDANRVVAELAEREIDARKSRSGEGVWSVNVEKDLTNRAIRELNALRLVPMHRSELPSSSLLPSREEEHLRHERQLSAGIEKTLRSIDGVLEARTHLNLQKSRDIFEPSAKKENGSGAVLLVVDEGYTVTSEQIATLVGKSSGVSSSDIAVVITPRERTRVKGQKPTSLLSSTNHESMILGTHTVLCGVSILGLLSILAFMLRAKYKRRRLYLSSVIS